MKLVLKTLLLSLSFMFYLSVTAQPNLVNTHVKTHLHEWKLSQTGNFNCQIMQLDPAKVAKMNKKLAYLNLSDNGIFSLNDWMRISIQYICRLQIA